MVGRIALGLFVLGACASPEPAVEQPAHAPSDSIYGIPPLDAAYRELELAMRPHGCTRCHTPMQLLEARRAIEPMIEADLMPPETADHPAGIRDEAARTVLLRHAKTFRLIGDATAR